MTDLQSILKTTPVAAAVGAAVVSAGALAYAVRVPSCSWLAPRSAAGTNTRPAIALTFDDGPSESTSQLLEVLARHRAPATFFHCGANVRRLARRRARSDWRRTRNRQPHRHASPARAQIRRPYLSRTRRRAGNYRKSHWRPPPLFPCSLRCALVRTCAPLSSAWLSAV